MPSGVCANTLPSRASTSASRSARPAATGSGPAARSVRTSRSVSSASTDQNATRSATTAAASHPVGVGGPPARRVDHRRDRPLHGVDARADPGRVLRPAQRLGVQPQGGERGAERGATGRRLVSRSSRSSSLIRPASVFSAPATTPTSTGAAGFARASSSPRASRCDTAATSIVGADQAAGQPVGHQQAHREQHHAEQGEQQPRPADAGRQCRVGDERADHSGPPLRVAHREHDLPAAVDEPGRAAPPRGELHRGVRGAAAPSTAPSGGEDTDLRGRGGVDLGDGEGQRGGVGDGDECGQRLGVRGRGEHRALGGDRAHQQRQRHEERDQHQRRRGRDEQQHPPAHRSPPVAGRTGRRGGDPHADAAHGVQVARPAARSPRACGATTTGARRRSCPRRRTAAATPR